MGAKKKLRNRVLGHMLAGEISVNQARLMLGRKPLRPPRRTGTPYRAPQRQGATAVKSAGSRGQAYPPGASVPARPALERMVDSCSNPADRETARAVLAGLDNGARNWAPTLPGLMRESQDNPDPWKRERARASLEKSQAGPERGPATSVRALTWGLGPDGEAWRQVPQTTAPGLQIAVPGTAGR
jgi:hypothetical protein